MCGNVEIVWPENSKEKVAIVSDREITLQKIRAALKEMRPAFMDVIHTFGDGIYTRTGTAKSGEVIIGAMHRAENIFHLSRGSVWVWEKFNGLRLLKAPFSEMTLPGTQRIGLVVEDIEGCNIFKTQSKNFGQVEAEMLFPFTLPLNAAEKIFEMSQKLLA